MRRFVTAFLTLGAFFFAHAVAEVQKLVITWTPGLCKATCIRSLDKQFRRIPGVADVQMSQPGARAEIKWKPDFTFSFRRIEAAMAIIGLSIDDITIKVRGTLSHDDANRVWLTSLRDGTRFILKSPIQPVPGQFVEFYNVASHSLTEAMFNQLIDAENANQVATIDGPLLMPERSPPYVLTISNVQFSDQSKE